MAYFADVFPAALSGLGRLGLELAAAAELLEDEVVHAALGSSVPMSASAGRPTWYWAAEVLPAERCC